MKKNINLKFFKGINPLRSFLRTVMRIFILIIALGFSAAFANSSYSQTKINISVKNATIQELFEEIQKTSEYVFFYKNNTIDTQQEVTLEMNKKTLDEILNKAFLKTDLAFVINGRQVVVKKREISTPKQTAVPASVKMQQGFLIKGTVVGTDGTLLPGASVIEKGTNNGAVTDFDGQFSLTVSSKSAILEVAYIGYKTIDKAIDGQSALRITLAEAVNDLEEVVVIGYGTVKKSDLTGSVSTLKGEVMEKTPIVTMEQALQGRLAGVNVMSSSGAPGAGMNIIIRGASSVSGSNQPLYVIDGMPLFNNSSDLADDFESGDALGNLNPLASLNPNDIESIEVLKDASSTAIYGSRGSNGVIMITTKRGHAGKGTIDVDFKYGYTLMPTAIPLVNAQQYAILQNEYKTYVGEDIIYDGTERETSSGDLVYFPTPEEIPGLMGDGTNWQEEIMRNANSYDLNARFSGGTKEIKYNVSTGFLNNEGVLKNTDFTRYSLRGNLNAKVNKVLTVNWNVNGSATSSNRSSTNTTRFDGGGAERSGAIVKSFMASPVMQVDESWFNDEIDNSNGDFGAFNPLVDLTEQYYFKNNLSVISNLSLNFKLSENLSFVTRGGIRYTNDKQDRYWNHNTSQGFRSNGKSLYNTADLQNLVNENFLTFDKKIQGHHFNIVGGVSFEKKIVQKHTYGFVNYSLEFDNGLFYDKYAEGQDPVMPITTKTEAKLSSVFGRLSYNYQGRYFITATGRSDGSSVFAENNKRAFFPSIGGAWSFQKEEFMENVSWLSNGKLRMSYGQSGNQAIAPYQSLPSLDTKFYSSIEGRTLGILPDQPGNVDLKWETTTQFDTGIDLSFDNNRYRLTFDYYKKTTDDLLLNTPVLTQSGYSSILSNFGKITNEGFEVELGLTPFNSKDFNWSVDMNWSTNKAMILELNYIDFIDFTTNLGGSSQPTHRLSEGGRIGNFYGFKTDGLLTQEDLDKGYPVYGGADDVGELKYVDIDGDGEITNKDRTIIGNAYPDYLFGINNSFRYKDFTMSFLFRGAIGQEVMNLLNTKTEMGIGLRGVSSADYYHNRWTPENPNGHYPRFTGTPSTINDRLIEKGSYIRLQNVTVGYNVPQNLNWLNNAQIYASAFNVFTIHDYNGYDPEVSSYGQNLLRGGVDRGSYPRSTTFVLGVKLKF